MYLKRLEIQGFKSFPEKIRLEFNEGITAVVGPNGSGKSNISDAVRWVLGEQSVKSLRGAKMEDVIFSGTANRRPLGFAEVSLVLDNEGRELPLDYSEVSVTRRVYRSGEGEYLINGTACRLRDVHELFMDTGIGRDGYSIIGQGRIDSILSSKSEDRRQLFEEAAGIVKYKNRRAEAAQKLEKEKQNLVRINDIIEELDRQIAPLKEQSEKAKRFLNISERLKLLQVNIFLNDADDFETDMAKLLEQMAGIKQSKEEDEGLLLLFKQDAKAEKERLTELEQDIEKENEEMNAASGRQRDKENEKKLIEQETEHLQKDRRRMEAETENKQKLVTEKKQQKNMLQTAIMAIDMQEARLAAELQSAQTEFERLNIKLSENEQDIEEANRRIVENMKQLSEVATDLNRVEFINEQLKKKQEEIEMGADYNESRIGDKAVRVEVVKRRYEDVNKTAETLLQKLAAVNAEREKNQNELDTIVTAQGRLNSALNEKMSRCKILTELSEDYEGYYNSVKAVLKKRKTDENFAGICGAVGELITVEAKYETAIETALGAALQHIVTKDEKAAQKAIEYLKSTKQGRATFLPISAIKGRDGVKPEILKENGVIGTAKSIVNYDYMYNAVISNLLERVIVIDNLDNAVVFAKKHAYSFKIVTADGDLLNAGGAMTGGSIAKTAANIFSRGRELSVLTEEIKSIESRLKIISQDIAQKREEANGLADRQDSLQSDIQEVRIELSDTKGELERESAALEELENKKQALAKEAEDIAENKNIIAEDLRLAAIKKDKLEQEERDIRKRLSESQNLMQGDKETKEERINALTDLRIKLSETQQNRKTQEERIKQTEEDIEAARKEAEELSIAIRKNEQDALRAKDRISKTENDAMTFAKEIIERRKAAESFVLQRRASQEQIAKTEEKIEEKNKSLAVIANEATRLAAKKENMEENNRRRYEYMWEEYEITYQSAKTFERLSERNESLQKEERETRTIIRDMGTVNVASIEEYRAVTERRAFLGGQREDILAAEGQLDTIIAELTRLMEVQFVSQLKLISENFDKVFAEIFGGGSAKLILSEDEDILSAGIEIAAEPPGKTLKNMLLLSGGERALTAIALLFAILKMKPSPFCILDEIEAALDDSNVYRYAEYLKKFSAETQFILITHRKGTMEAADVIYGVTMQEQGVSKLVSVKFTEENELGYGNV